jgi:peptide methionine sulfoxide reductase MsrA
MTEVYLTDGCFCGMEMYLPFIGGVQSTQVGYANRKYNNVRGTG